MRSYLISSALVVALAATAYGDEEKSSASYSGRYLDLALKEVAPPPLEMFVQDREPRKEDRVDFGIGPTAGYIKIRDADRGTWFGGVQARVRFMRYLGVEGSITFHQDKFLDGDVEVTQYPVQMTALLFPFPDAPVEPYALFGAGWYYTRVEFDSILGGGHDTDSSFGFHVGAGAAVKLGKQASLFADFRWIFMDEPGVDNGNLDEEEWDSGEVALGLNIGF